jgi:transcriptional regulator with XRE-family HTH domain
VLTPAAELLVRTRRNAGLSQAELARRAGVPRSVLNTYERGHRDPGTSALSRILDAAGSRLVAAPMVRRVDPERAGRILVQVIALAEELPFRRRESLKPSPLRRPRP